MSSQTYVSTLMGPMIVGVGLVSPLPKMEGSVTSVKKDFGASIAVKYAIVKMQQQSAMVHTAVKSVGMG